MSFFIGLFIGFLAACFLDYHRWSKAQYAKRKPKRVKIRVMSASHEWYAREMKKKLEDRSEFWGYFSEKDGMYLITHEVFKATKGQHFDTAADPPEKKSGITALYMKPKDCQVIEVLEYHEPDDSLGVWLNEKRSKNGASQHS